MNSPERNSELRLTDVLGEAKTALETGDLDRTSAMCRHVFRAYPRCVEAARVLGEAYAEQRHTNEADTLFQFVLRADPHDVLGYVDRGFIAVELHRLDEAITFFERAIELDPNIAQLRTELLNLYQERDGKRPRLRISKAGLANQRLRDGFTAQAIEEFGAILRETPDRLDVRVHLIEAHWRVRDYTRAELLATELLRVNGDLVKPHYLLWHIAQQPDRRNVEAGRTHLRAAQALDPIYLIAERLFADTAPDALDYLKKLEPAMIASVGDIPDEELAQPAESPSVAFEGLAAKDLQAVDRQLGLAPAVPLPPEPTPEPAEEDSSVDVSEDDWLASLMAETAAVHHVEDISQTTPMEEGAGSWLLDEEYPSGVITPFVDTGANPANQGLGADMMGDYTPFDLDAPEPPAPASFDLGSYTPFDLDAAEPVSPASLEPGSYTPFDLDATEPPASASLDLGDYTPFDPDAPSAPFDPDAGVLANADYSPTALDEPVPGDVDPVEIGSAGTPHAVSIYGAGEIEALPESMQSPLNRRGEAGAQPGDVSETSPMRRAARIRSAFVRHEAGDKPQALPEPAPVREARLASPHVRDEAGEQPQEPVVPAYHRDEMGPAVTDLSQPPAAEEVAEAETALGVASQAPHIAADSEFGLPPFEAEAASGSVAESPEFGDVPVFDPGVTGAPLDSADLDALPPFVAEDSATPAMETAFTVEPQQSADLDAVDLLPFDTGHSFDLGDVPVFDPADVSPEAFIQAEPQAGVAETTPLPMPIGTPPPWLADAALPSLDVAENEANVAVDAAQPDFAPVAMTVPGSGETDSLDLGDLPDLGVAEPSLDLSDLPDMNAADAAPVADADLDLSDLPDFGGADAGLDLSDLPDMEVAESTPSTEADLDLSDLPDFGVTDADLDLGDLPDMNVAEAAPVADADLDLSDLPDMGVAEAAPVAATDLDLGDLPDLDIADSPSDTENMSFSDLDLDNLPDIDITEASSGTEHAALSDLDLGDLPDLHVAEAGTVAFAATAEEASFRTAEPPAELNSTDEAVIDPRRSERGAEPDSTAQPLAFQRRSERGPQPTVDETDPQPPDPGTADDPNQSETKPESGYSAAPTSDVPTQHDSTDDSHEAAVQRLDSEEEQQPMPVSKKGNDNEPEENLFDWEREELPDYLRPFAISVDDASQMSSSAPKPAEGPSRTQQPEPASFDLGGGDALPSWLSEKNKPASTPSRSSSEDVLRVNPINRGSSLSGGGGNALPSWLDNAEFDDRPAAGTPAPRGREAAASPPASNYDMDDFDFGGVQPFDMNDTPQPSVQPRPQPQAQRPQPSAFPAPSPFHNMPIDEVDDLSAIQPFSPDDFQDVFGAPQQQTKSTAPRPAEPPKPVTRAPEPPARPLAPAINPGLDDTTFDLPTGMMPFDPTADFGGPGFPTPPPRPTTPQPRAALPTNDFDDFDSNGDFGNLSAFDPASFGGSTTPSVPPKAASRNSSNGMDAEDLLAQLSPFGASPGQQPSGGFDPGDPFAAFGDIGGVGRPGMNGGPGLDAFGIPDQSPPQGFAPFTGKLSDIAGAAGKGASSDDFDFEGSLAPFNFNSPDMPNMPASTPSRPRHTEETPAGGSLLRGLDKRRREAERDRAEQENEVSLFARMAARRRQQDQTRSEEAAARASDSDTVEQIPTIDQLDAQLDSPATQAKPTTPVQPEVAPQPVVLTATPAVTPQVPDADFEFQDFFSDEAEAAPVHAPHIDLSDTGDTPDDLFATFDMSDLRETPPEAQPDNLDDFDAFDQGTAAQKQPVPEAHHGFLHDAVDAVKHFAHGDARPEEAKPQPEPEADDFDFGDAAPFSFDTPAMPPLQPLPPVVQQPEAAVTPVSFTPPTPAVTPIAPVAAEPRVMEQVRPQTAPVVSQPAFAEPVAVRPAQTDVLAQAKANPRDIAANTAAAQQYMANNQFDEAIEHYLRVARSLDTTHAQTLLEKLQTVAPQYAQNPRYHRLLGDTYQRLGQSHWAVSEYSKALQVGKARR